MPAHQYNITDYSPHLFWDVDRSQLDFEKNKNLIVERVLQRGSRHDLNLLLSQYGKSQVREVIKQLPWLDDKDMAFVHVFFNLPYHELKCYTRKPLNRYY
jgi:hypothetical protein